MDPIFSLRRHYGPNLFIYGDIMDPIFSSRGTLWIQSFQLRGYEWIKSFHLSGTLWIHSFNLGGHYGSNLFI